ncbi:MAG: DegT/DnrJ/EryC1/StrS family aminotransferase [Candidatus Hydrogenedentes bacterium]|nr:DegT/DnrJ/EryC1/StrS family aminotransferase [Candidatus Hydrogenedentota bacterium]
MTDSTKREQEIDALVSEFRLPETVYVTQPSLPSLDAYGDLLKGIWERKWLTNGGVLHAELESELANYLDIEHLSLFCNGAIALLVALQALRITSGEVITTPFTFPATPHVLHWNRVTPVFADIDPKTFNLDPAKIERHIGSDTKAILAVHVYGTPCDVDAIQAIADRHGLHVIYDAAHAFGVKYKGRALADFGDISMLSFHATKLFTTIEGGALVLHNEAQRKRVNSLKNFGIADEETVIGPGINGKMNEFQAAFGLLQLKDVDNEIERRRQIAGLYRELLSGIPGVKLLIPNAHTRENFAYFPIAIDSDRFGMSRDALYLALKKFNIHTRKYFYPLCSQYPCYAALPSSRSANLPVAEKAAREILCIPIYGSLDLNVARHIANVIRKCQELSVS